MVYASCLESSRISDPGTVSSNLTISAIFVVGHLIKWFDNKTCSSNSVA